MRSPSATMPSALPQQVPVDAIERGVDGAVLKVLEQRRDFGKDVLAEKHEARAGPPRGPERGEADDRRIGQRDDDVGPADAEAGRRRGREIADVVRRAAANRPGRSLVPFARRMSTPRCTSRVTRRRPRSRLGARRVQRPSGDDRHLGAVAAHEILGQLGQQLSGRGLIGPVRPVEEADLHTSASRCARYQSIVRRRPARKSVVALKPNRFSARRDVEHAPRLPVRLACDRTPASP